MSIEKPISTIRKAIKGAAEEDALLELKESPEKKHLDDAFNFFRYIKVFEPTKFELLVKIAAEAKDIKDAIGLEKYKLFMDVWTEVCAHGENELKLDTYQILKSEMPLREKQKQNLLLNRQFYKQRALEIRNDSRILNAFKESEELMNKSIEFTTSTALKMLEFYQGETLNKVEDEESQQSLRAKIIKYLRGIN